MASSFKCYPTLAAVYCLLSGHVYLFFVILGLGYKRRDPWTFSEIVVVPYVFLSIKLLLTDTSISGGLDTVG